MILVFYAYTLYSGTLKIERPHNILVGIMQSMKSVLSLLFSFNRLCQLFKLRYPRFADLLESEHSVK